MSGPMSSLPLPLPHSPFPRHKLPHPASPPYTSRPPPGVMGFPQPPAPPARPNATIQPPRPVHPMQAGVSKGHSGPPSNQPNPSRPALSARAPAPKPAPGPSRKPQPNPVQHQKPNPAPERQRTPQPSPAPQPAGPPADATLNGSNAIHPTPNSLLLVDANSLLPDAVQQLLEEDSKAKINNGKTSAVEILNSYVVRERAKATFIEAKPLFREEHGLCFGMESSVQRVPTCPGEVATTLHGPCIGYGRNKQLAKQAAGAMLLYVVMQDGVPKEALRKQKKGRR